MIKATGSASAKAILFGEHAVVYGNPAIAIPLSDLRANAVLIDNTNLPYSIHIDAPDISVSSHILDLAVDHPIRAAFRFFYTAFNHPYPQNVTIQIHSQIPVASGLGSGAAVAIALFRALALYENIDLTNTQVSELAFEVEKIHHGTPSGIDNTVIAFEQPVWYIKNKACQPFYVKTPFHFLIANSGVAAATAVSVRDVRKLYDANPDRVQNWFDSIEEICYQAMLTLDSGDETRLGYLMSQNHTFLQQLTVSSSLLDKMVDCAMNAGALGAKLTGGGRGGNILILHKAPQKNVIQEALQMIGINQFFSTCLGLIDN